MVIKEVLVENQVGLHARPATFFIQRANEYKSSIWVEKDDRRVNAKSCRRPRQVGGVRICRLIRHAIAHCHGSVLFYFYERGRRD